MEDYYEYLDSNGVTTLYKLIKDDTVALIDSYSVTLNGITTTLDTHINDSDIHTPISDIENMVDTKISGLVNSAPETLDTLKELSDALGNDPNFATTVANQIGNKASKDSVYTKEETNTLLEGKANSVHSHVVSDITDFPAIPTKVSDLANDSGYITSVNWEDVTNKPKLSQVAISGSYSDLSGTPTIPTKTSQLINDSGFLTSSDGYITNVSWSDITDKPNFSTVATSGSYTDLSNTPTIPTKVSQLENDTGFINALTDVVDTKSNQTINGTKTFTSTPFVSGGGATTGIYLKNTAIARNEVPSTTYYSVLRTLDKNNKILGDYVVMKTDKGATNAQINIRSEDSNGNQLINALNFSMANDNSSVSFAPSISNKVSLGTSTYKWAKVYSDDIVHTSGTETIAGSKTFSNQIYLGAGGTSYGQISAKDNNSILRLFGGTSAGTGANLDLYGEGLSSGGFSLRARTSSKIIGLDGSIDGTLKWNGKNVALDENLVHTTGNETIAGTKTFSAKIISNKDLHYKDTLYDWSDTSLNTWCDAGHVAWFDKTGTRRMHELVGANGGVWRKVCYIKESQYFSVDSNRNISFHGNTTFNGNLTASKFIGNLQGNADTATKSSYLDNYSGPSMNKIYLDWDNQVRGYVGLKVDNTTMGGLITTNNIGSQSVNSATYSTTPATTDNSTRIATTAWVRTYVDSVAGNNTVGSSVSAYWSNRSLVTATGQASGGGYYPECYSEYITKTPVVGTIYSGAQLYTVLNTYASATASMSNSIYVTNNTAQATFSNPINASGKYLCTTANTVKFRAYTAKGSTSAVGASSVVNNSSTKSIFIRVQ